MNADQRPTAEKALPPRVGETVTVTGVVRTVEALFPDGHYRIELDTGDFAWIESLGHGSPVGPTRDVPPEETRCACGALTLATTSSERHDRGLHGADRCVGDLSWWLAVPPGESA